MMEAVRRSKRDAELIITSDKCLVRVSTHLSSEFNIRRDFIHFSHVCDTQATSG